MCKCGSNNHKRKSHQDCSLNFKVFEKLHRSYPLDFHTRKKKSQQIGKENLHHQKKSFEKTQCD